MKNRLLFVVVVVVLCGITFVSAQSTPNFVFVNTGEMNVSESAVMFVQGDMQMVDPAGHTSGDPIAVEVIHNGCIHLTGSFFHDATGNVFFTHNHDWKDRTQPRGYSVNVGSVHFVDDESASGTRFITSSNLSSFDRVANYIAFPNLVISTDDVIYVPPVLGLDAHSILRTEDEVSGEDFTGVLFLRSDLIDRNGTDYVYTASLRVVRTGGEAVSPDAVHIEKHVREFREIHDASGGLEAASTLFPFASPFQSMRAGVFAGNWVRRPQIDPVTNSFRFPYGNEGPEGGVINTNQFVRRAYDVLVPTEAHLIRLQVQDGPIDYLGVTAGEDHGLFRDRFRFGCGMPYASMGRVSDGRLFTGQSLLWEDEYTPWRIARANANVTQNWVIGNSFTSGLNAEGIAEYLMGTIPGHAAPASFVNRMFIFPHGSTHYEIYPMELDEDGYLIPIPDIHAMGVFMIAVARNSSQGGNVVINETFQVHTGGIPAAWGDPRDPLLPGPTPLGTRSAQVRNSTLNFVVTPENNPFVFSRSSVVFREGADVNADHYDISAFMNPSSHLFHLYGTNLSGSRLQRNALPYNAPLAMLSVNPASETMNLVLRVEGAENFASDVVELFDRQTNQWQDLRMNNSYYFTMAPGDNPDRFEVHFRPRVTTDVDNNVLADWQAYAFGGELIIFGLNDSSVNSVARIHGVSGVMHIQEPISTVPEHRINISSLPAGVYILSLEGRTVKFIR